MVRVQGAGGAVGALVVCACALTALLSRRALTMAAAAGGPGSAIRSVDFEVFGRVQGVFFRKYTQKHATNLSLKGWCRNTAQGTVQGVLQGPSENVASMMDWLKTKGSPSSQIDKAEFRNDKILPEYTFNSFDIVKD